MVQSKREPTSDQRLRVTPRAAWQAWRLYIEALIEGTCQPGGVAFVQTAGELLGWKVYEIDPLLCPYCRAEMRIVAFIVDLPSLRRLLRSLDLGPQLAQPLPRAPPTATELLYEAIDG